jgi:hypothetical protein
MTIDELIAQINDRGRPAAEEEIRQFEAEIGTTLPEDYRRFLAACNGGSLGGRLWYKARTPGGRGQDTGLHHVGGFRQESHFSLRSSRACYQGEDEDLRIPRDLLWIMDDPFGNAICLGLGGPYRGQVYFWDHEEEPDPDEWDGSVAGAENVTLLAASFTDFAAGLRPLDE